MEETEWEMLAAGDLLNEVEWTGAMTLQQLIGKLDWPVPVVMMAVGTLVRQDLVRATQRGLEVIVEPMPKRPGAIAINALLPVEEMAYEGHY